MSRLTPEDVLKTRQILPLRSIIAMMQRFGFGDPIQGKGDHIRLKHDTHEDLIIGLDASATDPVYQKKAAEACLEVVRRLEAETQDTAENFFTLTDEFHRYYELVERNTRYYVRSKKWPFLGFGFKRGITQELMDKHLKKLKESEERATEILGNAAEKLEFRFDVSDGNLEITHPVYPISETFPAFGDSNFVIRPYMAFLQIFRLCQCFDRVCNQGLDELYERKSDVREIFTLTKGEIDEDGLIEITIRPRPRTRVLSHDFETLSFRQTTGGRISPKEMRGLIENYLYGINKGMYGLAETAGWKIVDDGNGTVTASHPYHPSVYKLPSPMGYQLSMLEMIDSIPNTGNEVDYSRFIELTDKLIHQDGKKIGNLAMMQDLGQMQDRCEPKVEEFKKQLRNLGFVTDTLNGPGENDVTITYRHTKDKTRPTLTIRTMRIKVDGKHTYVLAHDRMVKDMETFLKNPFGPPAPDKSLPGVSTPFNAPKQGLPGLPGLPTKKSGPQDLGAAISSVIKSGPKKP